MIIVIVVISISLSVGIYFATQIQDTSASSASSGSTPLKDCPAARTKYLSDYSDVAYWKLDPWVHYQNHGKGEKRKWNSNLC